MAYLGAVALLISTHLVVYTVGFLFGNRSRKAEEEFTNWHDLADEPSVNVHTTGVKPPTLYDQDREP